MTVAVLGLVVGMCLVAWGGFRSATYTHRVIDEINRQLPPDKRESWIGWHVFKAIRVFEEYRRLYPEGRLHIDMLTANGVGAIGLLIAAISIIAIAILRWQ